MRKFKVLETKDLDTGVKKGEILILKEIEGSFYVFKGDGVFWTDNNRILSERDCIKTINRYTVVKEITENADCKICFEGHPEFDYQEGIWFDKFTGKWLLHFTTGDWDYTTEKRVVETREANYCYNCGRGLE